MQNNYALYHIVTHSTCLTKLVGEGGGGNCFVSAELSPKKHPPKKRVILFPLRNESSENGILLPPFHSIAELWCQEALSYHIFITQFQ
jgi:hypothetical protein